MAAKVVSFAAEPVSLAETAAAFLAERDLARTSRRVYALTMARLEKALGSGFPVAELDGGAGKEFLCAAYPKVSPRPGTQRDHAQELLRLLRQGWMMADPTEAIERRRVSTDETRALSYEELETLWSRREVPVREKALWRRCSTIPWRGQARSWASPRRRRRGLDECLNLLTAVLPPCPP